MKPLTSSYVFLGDAEVGYHGCKGIPTSVSDSHVWHSSVWRMHIKVAFFHNTNLRLKLIK
jgi:hypothetical protein